jgi:flagellar biosynthesis protein FlhB
MFTDVKNSNYARWFFAIFYVCAVVIALNLMVAFVIDMFNSQWEIAKVKRLEKEEEE